MKTTSADIMRKLRSKRKEDDDFDIQAHLEKEKECVVIIKNFLKTLTLNSIIAR